MFNHAFKSINRVRVVVHLEDVVIVREHRKRSVQFLKVGKVAVRPVYELEVVADVFLPSSSDRGFIPFLCICREWLETTRKE